MGFGGNFFDFFYLKLAKMKYFQSANERILNNALRAYGYNNYENHKESGEDYFITKILPIFDPKICVDIGANVGNYSKILLERTGAKVYAFEPLAAPFASLLKLAEQYPDRFVPINKGVGAENETLVIHYSDDATSHASFSAEVANVPYVVNEKEREIEVVSLDSYFSQIGVDQVDFIKIDTEGFEYEVLTGARGVIDRCKPKIIHLEYNWHQMFRSKTLFALSQLLQGYVPYQMLSNRLEKRDPKNPFANIYHFSNFVFVLSDFIDKIP